MSKTYSVWIEIEEHDDETDEYQTLDAPGASVAEFDSYEKAWAYAESLSHIADELAGEHSTYVPEATDGKAGQS